VRVGPRPHAPAGRYPRGAIWRQCRSGLRYPGMRGGRDVPRVIAGVLFCIAMMSYMPAARAQFDILPKPLHLTPGQGAFELRDGGSIAAPADARAQWIADFLRDAIHAQTGVGLQVISPPERGRITLRIDPSIPGDGAYRLDVKRGRVAIAAADERGLFWGVQTFRQLLPLQHEVPPAIPAVSIEDAPRYAWRGVMLDTARHFYPVEFIKQQIEMPGHTSAAIAAYPELSCSGKPITVPTTWGVFRDVDCVGKDATFKFLQHVLDEVIALFPSPYVHIGGDEVPEGVWADCAACQELAHTQGLNGEQGLHGYFVRRIQTYLAGKGKTMVGWDEILEGR